MKRIPWFRNRWFTAWLWMLAILVGPTLIVAGGIHGELRRTDLGIAIAQAVALGLLVLEPRWQEALGKLRRRVWTKHDGGSAWPGAIIIIIVLVLLYFLVAPRTHVRPHVGSPAPTIGAP